MIKAINLKKINDDINLLECNGKYQAAKILHKKFIREAQSSTLTPEPKRDSGPYKKVFDKYLNLASTTPSQNLISTIRSDGFLLKEDQDQLINYVNERLRSLTTAPTATPDRVNKPASQPVIADEPTYKYNPNLYITPNPFEDRTVSLNTQSAELAGLQKMTTLGVQPQGSTIADPTTTKVNENPNYVSTAKLSEQEEQFISNRILDQVEELLGSLNKRKALQLRQSFYENFKYKNVADNFDRSIDDMFKTYDSIDLLMYRVYGQFYGQPTNNRSTLDKYKNDDNYKSKIRKLISDEYKQNTTDRSKSLISKIQNTLDTKL